MEQTLKYQAVISWQRGYRDATWNKDQNENKVEKKFIPDYIEGYEYGTKQQSSNNGRFPKTRG